MMTVREESIAGTIADDADEMRALINANYAETNGEDPFVINVQMALEFEAAGMLLLAVMRDDEHRICGYTFNLVRRHQNHGHLMADCRAIYVKPGCRGFAPFILERETERMLKERGVYKSHISTRLKNDIGPFIAAAGYKPAVMTYEKVL